VFGEGQRGLVALVVPARGEGRGASREELAEEIERRLAGTAREEQVRDFTILERPFSIELGELTPKLSLCRERIAAHFAAELSDLGRQGPAS
jgi:long-subunit acyl-CoA synthetase (AMP-forming)